MRCRSRALEVLKRLVRGATDEQLEKRFGSQIAQRALFTGMARPFDPKFAFGFEGDILYELSHHGNGKPPDRWTVRVKDGSAEAIPGGDGASRPSPSGSAWRTSCALPREEADPQELIFTDRFGIEGDLHVAAQTPEMFGGPARF